LSERQNFLQHYACIAHHAGVSYIINDPTKLFLDLAKLYPAKFLNISAKSFLCRIINNNYNFLRLCDYFSHGCAFKLAYY